MKIAFGDTIRDSTRVSRVGCGVPPQQSFLQQRITKVRDREDAITNTRDACATQSSFDRDLSDPL